MIAIDLDGTLLSPEGKVTPRVKQAVHRALKAGLLVCFATGRNWTESRMVLDAIEHYSSAVFVGGAMVVDTSRDVTLHRQLMDQKLAAEVSAVLEEMGHAVLALQDTEKVGVDYLITDNVTLDASTKQWVKVTAAGVRFVRRLGEYAHEHTVRVGVVASRESVEKAKSALEKKFADRVVVQAIYVPAYDVEVLEVFDPSVNKWEGLLHVARHHEIDPSQIIAVGDDLNDLAMIANAGLGVAMGNARPEVKAIATKIIGANKDEGLAAFLDELVNTGMVEPLAT
jgi:5-amino-6-(5-phospho-D-ribitylamino)uracil phosphatase